jgi:hypothetical protein
MRMFRKVSCGSRFLLYFHDRSVSRCSAKSTPDTTVVPCRISRGYTIGPVCVSHPAGPMGGTLPGERLLPPGCEVQSFSCLEKAGGRGRIGPHDENFHPANT